MGLNIYEWRDRQTFQIEFNQFQDYVYAIYKHIMY